MSTEISPVTPIESVNPVVTVVTKPSGNKKTLWIVGGVGCCLLVTIGVVIAAVLLLSRFPLATGSDCNQDGMTYKNGESFLAGDNCNTCSCVNGQAACTMMSCIDPSGLPLISPDPSVEPTGVQMGTGELDVVKVAGAKVDLTKEMCFSGYTSDPDTQTSKTLIYCANYDGYNVHTVVESNANNIANLKVIGKKIYFAADKEIWVYDTAMNTISFKSKIICTKDFEYKLTVSADSYIYKCTDTNADYTDFYVGNGSNLTSHFVIEATIPGRGVGPSDVNNMDINDAGTFIFYNTSFYDFAADTTLISRLFVWDVSKSEALPIVTKINVSFAGWYDNDRIIYQDSVTSELSLYNIHTGVSNKFMDGILIRDAYQNGKKVAYSSPVNGGDTNAAYVLDLNTKVNKKIADNFSPMGWQDDNTIVLMEYVFAPNDPESMMLTGYKLLGYYSYKISTNVKSKMVLSVKEFTSLDAVTKDFTDNKTWASAVWNGD